MIIELKDHLALKMQLLRLIPKYRKHKAIIVITDSIDMVGTYWDGGSRSSYSFMNMATGAEFFAPQYNPPQFGGPQVAPKIEIKPGTLCVSTGTFRGKIATATVYLNPADKERFNIQ